jgi:hypothetical protein
MAFNGTVGGPDPTSQTLQISNGGSGILNWSVSEGANWLSLSPTSGTSIGETDVVTVKVSLAGLTAGTYNTTITIKAAPPAENSPQTTAVTLVVDEEEPLVCFNPFPPDGAIGVNPTSITLSWQGSAPIGNELIYTIRFGKTPTMMPVVVIQSEETYHLEDLEESTAYYWSCTPRDEQGREPEEVPVWTFTTGAGDLCDWFPPIGQSSTFQDVESSEQFTWLAEAVSELVAGRDVYRVHVVDEPPGLGAYEGCDSEKGPIGVATDVWDVDDPEYNWREYYDPPVFACLHGAPVGSSCEWVGIVDDEWPVTSYGLQARTLVEVLAYETISVPLGTFTNTMKVRESSYDGDGNLYDGPYITWRDATVGLVRAEEVSTGSAIVLIAFTPAPAPAAVSGQSAQARHWGSNLRFLKRIFGGRKHK